VKFVFLAQNRFLFENQDRPKNGKNEELYQHQHFLVCLDSQTKICFEPNKKKQILWKKN